MTMLPGMLQQGGLAGFVPISPFTVAQSTQHYSVVHFTYTSLTLHLRFSYTTLHYITTLTTLAPTLDDYTAAVTEHN